MELNPASHVTHDKMAIDLTVSKCWLLHHAEGRKFNIEFYIYVYIHINTKVFCFVFFLCSFSEDFKQGRELCFLHLNNSKSLAGKQTTFY